MRPRASRWSASSTTRSSSTGFSAQTLAFVARRLLAERVALVFALRETGAEHELAGVPELVVGGLSDGDARALLDSVLRGPLDERVHERIVAETRGNPLALLELPRGLTPAELAGGFGLSDTMPLTGRIEQGFLRRLEPLSVETRRVLLAAAAEPIGDATLLWRAVERLGIGPEAAGAAEATGLIEIGARVRFRHPLVRSAAYRSASPQERQDVHRVLAEVTDPQLDPDRRAWHRAHATPEPDEDVAAELERSAAQARGGLAAAAAFLEHAALLTPDPERRAQRGLAAARAKRDAGALAAALGLLAAVDSGPADPLRTAEAERLRGQIAFDERRSSEAARLLRHAAKRFEPLNAHVARETHLEALAAALWASGPDGPDGVLEAAEAARTAPPAPDPARAVDAVLDALTMRFTEGYTAAAPALTRAVEGVLGLDVEADDIARWPLLAGNRGSAIVVHRWAELLALEIWDFDALQALAARQVRLARDAGVPVQLQYALNFLANTHLLAGELPTAAALVEEDQLIAEATGNPPVAFSVMTLAAWRGVEAEASALIEAGAQEAEARGQRRMVSFPAYASSVLNNGLGRHDAARDAAHRVFKANVVGYGTFVAPEVAEAASRTGDALLLAAALRWLSERTKVTPTEWALGIEARMRALLGEGESADRLYRESIERLGRTRVRVELARGHLLYGQWLRRDQRRIDAREQLRTAHDMFAAMGIEGFAERARRELLATGETARKRTHRDHRRADVPGGAHRAARRGRPLQPRDRHPLVHQPAHRRMAPEEGLHEARHQFPQAASGRAAGVHRGSRPRLARQLCAGSSDRTRAWARAIHGRDAGRVARRFVSTPDRWRPK